MPADACGRHTGRDYGHRPDNAAPRDSSASTAGVLRRLTVPSPARRDDVDVAGRWRRPKGNGGAPRLSGGPA
jgi:hypothetical protein